MVVESRCVVWKNGSQSPPSGLARSKRTASAAESTGCQASGGLIRYPSLRNGLPLTESHWTRRRRDFHVAAALILAEAGKNHGVVPQSRRVTIQMYRKRPVDRDGGQGACKPVFDALVRFGWAKDDSEEYMEQVVLPVIVDRMNPPKMTISVEV